MKHLNLIRKLAWSFHNSTGINWEDLFSEGVLAYYESLNSFNPTKGKETTWMYTCITNQLTNFCKKEGKQKNLYGIDDWYLAIEPAFNYEILDEQWESFSKDVQSIILMVLADPFRYLPVNSPGKNYKKCVGNISRDLREKKHWKYNRIYEGMRDLRNSLMKSVEFV